MIALAACGDSVPGNSVASVDGETVSREQFRKWLSIAASTSQPQGTERVAYAPPGYASCVATKKKTAPKPAKGQPSQTDAQFKTQCKQEYEGLRDQVMQFLILEKWVSGEADDQGVELSAATADKEFETAKKQSFPKEKDFQDFLKSVGDDARRREVPGALQHRLHQAAREGRQGRRQGHRQGRQEVLRQEQGALRDARHARPARHPDEDRGARQRGQAGAGERPELDAPSPSASRSTRRPRTRADRCWASRRARRRSPSTTRSSRRRRAS